MKNPIVKLLLAGGLALFVLTPVAFAAEFIAPQSKTSGTLVIGSNESHRNLYVAGATLLLNGPVQGDLFAAGGNVTIDGAVEQDTMVAGGNVVVNGRVGGDLRSGAGTLVVNSEVVGDALIGSGDVRFTESASIGGDLIVGGGNVVIDAPVNGSIRIAGGSVVINSAVSGSVHVRAGDRVTFGPRAAIPSRITVRAPQEPVIEQGATVSSPEYSRVSTRDNRDGAARIFTLGFLVQLLAYIIAGWLLIRLLPKRSNALARGIEHRFWSNLGIGLVAIIIVPIVSLIVLVTFVGYYISLVTFAALALLLLISCLFAAIFLGAWIIKKLGKKQGLAVDWQAVLLGAAVFMIVGLIPVVGFLVQVILVLATFGALLRYLRVEVRREEQGAE